jgi:hypothetical protein
MATVTGRELDTTALEGQVRGQLIAPDDPGYDEARQVYNAMIDKRPALIVRAADFAARSSISRARPALPWPFAAGCTTPPASPWSVTGSCSISRR